MKNPKSGPKPETKCFYCKGTGHWKQNYPKYLADKKDGKVNKLKSGSKPETKCFNCKGTGHWKRNYPNYLVDKKAK